MLSELGDSWKQYDVLGIDEGQFFKDVSVKTHQKYLLPLKGLYVAVF